MNILEGFTNQEIDERMTRLAKSERKITHLVLSNIEEVQRRKIYLDYGLTSTFQYLTKRHGYCESSAYLRIQASKVLARHPELQDKIESGSVKLTQLAKVQKCVTQISAQSDGGLDNRPRGELGSKLEDDFAGNLKVSLAVSESPESKSADRAAGADSNFLNQDLNRNLNQDRTSEKMALDRLDNKTGFETDKILAIQFRQKPVQHHKVSPQSDGSVRLEFSISAQEFEEIKRAQSHVSHSVVGGNLGQLFVHLAKLVNKKIDGKEKHSTKLKHELTQSLSAKEKLGRGNSRKYLSVRVRRRLLQNAGHRCEHVDEASGIRCDSQFQLQVDHIFPVALGGADTPENLRILCGVHNRVVAQAFGFFRMNSEKNYGS